MKFNYKELAEYSCGEATIEGRLHHKKITGGFSQAGFKERWFKLRANILFYFNANETGKSFNKKPAGAFILENVAVQYEMNSEVPFSFSLLFHDEFDKKHLFSGRTEEYVNQWVSFLKQASYEFWRSQLIMLQTKLCMLTGRDPLLMYPRNEGSSSTYPSESVDYFEKTRRQQSTFRSYVTAEEETKPTETKQMPREDLMALNSETIVNGLELIGSDLSDVHIAPPPPPTPPKRPARANKAAASSDSSPNLIEL